MIPESWYPSTAWSPPDLSSHLHRETERLAAENRAGALCRVDVQNAFVVNTRDTEDLRPRNSRNEAPNEHDHRRTAHTAICNR